MCRLLALKNTLAKSISIPFSAAVQQRVGFVILRLGNEEHTASSLVGVLGVRIAAGYLTVAFFHT